MKGGVGKTTLVVFLAEGIAAEEPSAKVLVVDADPQASASVALIGDERLKQLIEDGKTIDAFLNDNLVYPNTSITRHIVDLIKRNVSSTTHNNVPLDISLLPCGPFLRLIEKTTVREFAQHGLGPDAYEMRLWAIWKNELKFMRKQFDYIIFDCAPSLSVLNEMMIRSAEIVILPTVPDFISSYGLNAFLHSVWNFPIASLPKPSRAPYVAITRFQANLKQHKSSARDIVKEANDAKEYRTFKTYVPNAVQFSEALSKGDEYPTFINKYSSKIVNEVISPLVDEIREALNEHAS
jgi:chromosome partitioning protein